MMMMMMMLSSQVQLGIDQEGPEGEDKYSSTFSLTSALDVGGQSMPRHEHFTPGKDPVPIV